METTTSFSDWLMVQLRDRGWDQAELVRRSGMSSGTISRIITGSRKPGTDATKGIARALKMPVEEVMRKAGLLPVPAGATADDLRSLAELYKKIEKLSGRDRQIVVDMVNRMASE